MDDREPTRRELADALAKSQEQNAALALQLEKMGEIARRLEKLEAPVSDEDREKKARDDARHLAAAVAELNERRPGAATAIGLPSGPKPALIPYQGSVQATVDCFQEGSYRKGPHDNQPGDVFSLKVDALWSDDPFRPVNIVGAHEDGSPIVEVRRDLVPIDFRFRPKTDEALAQMQPRKAAEF